MILEPAFETMPRPELQALQTRRLRELVAFVYERVPFYQRALERNGVRPDDARSLDELARLPITRKDDLHDHYPLQMRAVPQSEVARIHGSSGTTGKLTVAAYTRGDLDVSALVNARCLPMAGARPARAEPTPPRKPRK